MLMRWLRPSLVVVMLAIVLTSSPSPALANDGLELFETKIRPALIEHCYACHNSTTATEASLAVDDRESFLRGGESGEIIVPGKPAESRLIAILRHEIVGLKMPEGGVKFDEALVKDFERWIELGAPDPRDAPPSEEELEQATSWEVIREKRKSWWSFQPIRNVNAPSFDIDQFIHEKWSQSDLQPSEMASPEVLVRRLYFTLIGLPPTPQELLQWSQRVAQPHGYEALVDHLLDSPHFGERWARHWMDWIRYADSHGSEGDPALQNGWLYRDYLIRALNQDLPYDQLVREHIAGDLLDAPRINHELGINESAIGPAHWRMVFHGFAPTDALEEKVRFIDDQINVFSKAFLGLTVSCARCHDHKFDAISQKDYYALFATLASCRPGRVAIDAPEVLEKNRDSLESLKPQLRDSLARDWKASLSQLPKRLTSGGDLLQLKTEPQQLLNHWQRLSAQIAEGKSFDQVWAEQSKAWTQALSQATTPPSKPAHRHWRFNEPSNEPTNWFRSGNGLASTPSRAGAFAVAPEGATALTGIYPAGIYSHLTSSKHAARLSSDRVDLPGQYDVWIRAIGDGGSTSRFVVHDYPRNGTVFPVTPLRPSWQWHRFDLTYWDGDNIHLELTSSPDAPLLTGGDARSWFGVREAKIVAKGGTAPQEFPEALTTWLAIAAQTPPVNLEQAAEQFTLSVSNAIDAWQADELTDTQACLLDACVREGLLSNQLDQLTASQPLIDQYRRLEAEIKVPTRVPGLEESVAIQQPLYLRGDHKQPDALVPRRFLEAIDPSTFTSPQSGRLELADAVLSPDNPFTHRVIVNRLWHHLFGRGIVATPDNFGRLGSEPSHPELLDHLATCFRAENGSIKSLIRYIVLSKTWRLSSRPTESASQRDPDNLLLSHAHVRRLEAEAIRDSMLAVSGRLDANLFGAPADGNSMRRSVYVRVNRNSLDPFLRAFDFPEPFSSVGRRDVTNVPAQSLTMMNDPRVSSLAFDWANRVLRESRSVDGPTSESDRIAQMFLAALGRTPAIDEVTRLQAYMRETESTAKQLHLVYQDLQKQLARVRSAQSGMLEPLRKRLIDERKAANESNSAESNSAESGADALPKPIGSWEFEGDFKDHVGGAHGEPQGGASIASGQLVVHANAYVVSKPIDRSLRAKTLEAWVQLDDLAQHGGGVMSIQSLDGSVFDSIVFAEQAPRQWLSGSEFFSRTQSFGGSAENEADRRLVQIAIVYHEDGQVIAYRDGEPYGKSYQSKGPREFKANETIVSFGVRHLPAGGNRMLSGRIAKAQLYDHALDADQVRRSARSHDSFVSDAEALAAMSDGERQAFEELQTLWVDLESRLVALQPLPDKIDEAFVWADVANAIFNFKEFIFVK